MSNLQLFSNGEFELPFIPDGDGFRVHGGIVARQLAFKDASNMVRTLDDDEKVLVTPEENPLVSTPLKFEGRDDQALYGAAANQGVWYLTEAGFYRIVGQRNVNAIRDEKVRTFVAKFQRWVFHEVLPQMLRTGQASEALFIGTTWSWDDVAAEIRQRYGLDYKPSEVTRALRAAGWLKAGGTTPKHEHRWKFWHTGTAYHLFPHVLPELVAALVPVMQEIGDPQANQCQLSFMPALKGLPGGES
ncbi:Bro-N domain-containing protein [Mycobacterium sp. 48b]|uniref:BRO-N domain-containing protein n=1 Tax=Mycobacterium sp. 48b TaxID=3400426 RepID=UPI003AAF0AB4